MSSVQPMASEKEVRIVLRNFGEIDPEDIDAYRSRGGYQGLKQALAQTPAQVIEAVASSGLRERGGRWNALAQAWRSVVATPGEARYLVCNAGEGDPEAPISRALLENDPHGVVEGLAIAAHALGAGRAYVYVPAEHQAAIARLKTALEKASGLLGSLGVEVVEGAVGFACEEEIAIIAALEGRGAMPRVWPPGPLTLWGGPVAVHTAETLAALPWVPAQGPEAYARLGAPNWPGTKVLALSGVSRPGLVEVPLSLTVRELVYQVGGGVVSGLKAVCLGGPAGGSLPESALDIALTPESLEGVGVTLGWGGIVAREEKACPVAWTLQLNNLNRDQVCGLCAPCRVGTRELGEILACLGKGQGQEGDPERLERIAKVMKETSVCSLGQEAANPVLSTLRYFADEYRAHIEGKGCPQGVCPG